MSRCYFLEKCDVAWSACSLFADRVSTFSLTLNHSIFYHRIQNIQSIRSIVIMTLHRSVTPPFPPAQRSDKVISETAFAGPYLSSFTKQAQKPLLDLLEHVNCSYLSSPTHRAVTLEDLKQHAHSLTVLIRHLGVSTSYGAVDNRGNSDARFADGEVFDWLNDLRVPYRNEDESHSLPLTTLQNQLLNSAQIASEQERADQECRHACPMLRSDVSDRSRQKLLPLATNELLAKHANEILERLDHEFSSSGGLLGMLPVAGRGHEQVREIGEKSVLGQWIAFTRSLVLRCHDLERSYANALDVVAGEAFVPREMLSEVGTVGRRPQPVSYAQDRFVLCNVQQEQWGWLNDRLAAKEMEQQELQQGSLLTWVEVPTRYYRLGGQPTVFVVPQWEGTSATSQVEERPTVVQVVKPTWGARASAWEEKHEKEMQRLRLYEPDLDRLIRENKDLQEDIEVMAQEKKMFEVERRLWRAAADDEVVEAIEETRLQRELIDQDRKDLEAREKDVERRKDILVEMQLKAEEWIGQEKLKWGEANPRKTPFEAEMNES